MARRPQCKSTDRLSRVVTLFLLFSLQPDIASADLSAGGVLSLEWLVDSADEIFEQAMREKPSLESSARRVLTHLRYRENFADPLNKRLVGRWNLHGRLERVELELRDDHSCVINTIPTKSGAATPRPLTGKGHWSIRDGRLWISRSHIQRDKKWEPAIRQFFDPKKILKATEKEITLQGGPKMVRP